MCKYLSFQDSQNSSLHFVTKELLVCHKTCFLYCLENYFFFFGFFPLPPVSTSANILLTDTYVPKISDFGLARASVTFTQTIMTERIVGTAAYMAPEALRGEITPKSDIFSFGVVSRMWKAVYDFFCKIKAHKIKSI